MIKYLDSDEWYPVYTLRDGSYLTTKVEVSKKFLGKYDRIMKEFNELQIELQDMESED